ncbi:formimidoylglutamate deiminase [Microlunatus soli]|uniref:Formiminoglutamate deiminase n=1 Tax=Microlunatus soli TaxID=630515 RepID=A0A1H1Q2E6_9ACTN|nr:formimidoylglutamate deiminase [Microlunatus soli]SDS17149.1 formiminoglutamate deiminase [Microlunatus soli]
MTTYWAEHAILPDGPADSVRLEEQDGRWAAISAGVPAAEARRLPGVVLPGFANCHSHAFHRALRGRTHHHDQHGGSFWTWRTAMYRVAGRLDPDSYLALARATYAEMALSGITAVGEFHYLHHGPDGTPYDDPNAMAAALRQAAADAGVRLTLLDTCYLSGGLNADGHQPVDAVQRRFSDGDADRWAGRVADLTEDDNTRIGAAIHSVRAVPADQFGIVDAAAGPGPLHVHLSEQPAENEASQGHYRRTPTQLLADAGILSPRTSAVHATHLTGADIRALGASRSIACICPTTERDLADGIGPTRGLADAGTSLSLGTDQHAMIDFFEELRGLELDERLQTGRRGNFTPTELLDAGTAHASIGWSDAGQLAVGMRADLVAVDDTSPRTAGCDPEQLLFAAGGTDVHTVINSGSVIVEDHRHRLGDIGRLLTAAIEPIWRKP